MFQNSITPNVVTLNTQFNFKKLTAPKNRRQPSDAKDSQSVSLLDRLKSQTIQRLLSKQKEALKSISTQSQVRDIYGRVLKPHDTIQQLQKCSKMLQIMRKSNLSRIRLTSTIDPDVQLQEHNAPYLITPYQQTFHTLFPQQTVKTLKLDYLDLSRGRSNISELNRSQSQFLGRRILQQSPNLNLKDTSQNLSRSKYI